MFEKERDEMKTVTLVQARTQSTRLPYKVMMSLCGKPLLVRIVERIEQAKFVSCIVVVTSTNKEDDIIEDLCKAENIECFRGDEVDLLDRHYKAAIKYDADTVVKIPSDCPLIDPEIIDKVILFFIEENDKYDYVSNLHPASYPDGNDVEIMSFEALEKTWFEAKHKLEREHTTPYIWENPDKFIIGNVELENKLDYSNSHRWTIDYEEDYVFIKKVYEELYPEYKIFNMYQILKLLQDKPFLKNINKKYVGQYWYDNHIDELRNIKEYKRKKKMAVL